MENNKRTYSNKGSIKKFCAFDRMLEAERQQTPPRAQGTKSPNPFAVKPKSLASTPTTPKTPALIVPVTPKTPKTPIPTTPQTPETSKNHQEDYSRTLTSKELFTPKKNSPKTTKASSGFLQDSPKSITKSPATIVKPKTIITLTTPDSSPTKSTRTPTNSTSTTPTTTTTIGRLPEIDKNSLKCLEPASMLNDTIVEFYMNYILESLSEDDRSRTHLFNTFFYNKIKNLDMPCENDESNQAVKRWDKHVKMFDKDYLVVPICDYKHWVLVIVCFPDHTPTQDDELVVIKDSTIGKKRGKKPSTILIFDSLGYKYLSKFTNPIRLFMNRRWQYEKPDKEKRDFTNRELLKDVSAKVPRQKNLYDCGVFLLHSFQKFFQSPLLSFYQITSESDLTQMWQVDTKAKREQIKQIIRSKGTVRET